MFTTSCGEREVVQTRQKTGCLFTRIAIDKSTARGWKYGNRVLKRAFERLERHAGKLARAVLRGRDGGSAVLLPDTTAFLEAIERPYNWDVTDTFAG